MVIKLTIHQASKLDRYPIPRIEDLFAKLSVGKQFMHLDLNPTHQQLLLPLGVSSVPGIFQHTMKTLLHGIQNVVVYIDDILVTGITEEVHLNTLNEVLHCQKMAGYA